METFSASNAGVFRLSISRFKIRHGFISKKLCGQSVAVLNNYSIKMWFEEFLRYKDCNIYRMVVTFKVLGL